MLICIYVIPALKTHEQINKWIIFFLNKKRTFWIILNHYISVFQILIFKLDFQIIAMVWLFSAYLLYYRNIT